MGGTLRLASKAHLPEFARSANLANATPTSYLLPEQIDERCVASCLSGNETCARWQACPPPEPEFDYLCDDLSTPPLDGCCAGAGVVGGKRACPIGCGVYQ